MDRRTFIGCAASGLLALPFAAETQQAARLARIGVLASGDAGTSAANLSQEVLRQGLQELGYVDGRTAVIEWRSWEGKPERLREAAQRAGRVLKKLTSQTADTPRSTVRQESSAGMARA